MLYLHSILFIHHAVHISTTYFVHIGCMIHHVSCSVYIYICTSIFIQPYLIQSLQIHSTVFIWIGVAAEEEARGKDWWILIRNASICAPRQLSPISRRNARMARCVCYNYQMSAKSTRPPLFSFGSLFLIIGAAWARTNALNWVGQIQLKRLFEGIKHRKE